MRRLSFGLAALIALSLASTVASPARAEDPKPTRNGNAVKIQGLDEDIEEIIFSITQSATDFRDLAAEERPEGLSEQESAEFDRLVKWAGEAAKQCDAVAAQMDHMPTSEAETLLLKLQETLEGQLEALHLLSDVMRRKRAYTESIIECVK